MLSPEGQKIKLWLVLNAKKTFATPTIEEARVADRAKTAGVEVLLEQYEEMWHAWHHFVPQLPEAGRAIGQIGIYIGPRLVS